MKISFSNAIKHINVKSIFSLNDTLTNKISFYHLVLFLVALPFDLFYSELILVSFAIHTLIHSNRNFHFIRKKEFLFLISPFLITVLFTIFSNNLQQAFSLWTRQLAILLFPVCFFFNELNYAKYAKRLLFAFAFTCTVVIGYLYFDALRIILYYHFSPSALLSPLFMNHQFSEPIGIHATYLSLYVYMSLVTVIHFLLGDKRKGSKLAYGFCAILLFLGLIQLGSRAVLLALLINCIIVVPFLLPLKKRKRFLLFSVFAFITLGVLVANSEAFSNRFLQTLEQDLSVQNPQQLTDSRMKRWQLAIELVKTSPFIGHGTGDEMDLLKEAYYSHKLYDSYLNKLDTHNQYLYYLLTAGLIGLGIYLATLFWGLRLAISSKHVLFLSFLILVICVSMSENILSRNKGIFFYSFFFSLFVKVHRKESIINRKRNEPKKAGNRKEEIYVFTN